MSIKNDSAQLPPTTFDEWLKRESPAGCVSDMEMGWNAATEALRAQVASVVPVALMDLIQQHLTSAYACTRVWEAWSVGTMSEDDFTPLAETDFAHDLAGEIAKLYAGAPPAHIPAVEALDDANPLMALAECAALLENPRLRGDGVRCEVAAKNARAAMRLLSASSPATAVDAGIGQQAEYWGGLAQQKADADVRRGVTMPVSYYASTVVGAALQASRQPVAQQAAAEGAGDELLAVCKAFISKHRISCAESIYQTDRIMEDATTFIEQVCDLVGYEPSEGDDE